MYFVALCASAPLFTSCRIAGARSAVIQSKPAALTSSAGESVTTARRYFDNNVIQSLVLLEAARAHDVKCLVFSSTCATYGPAERLPISETAPQRPINPYGETKRFTERALHRYRVAHGFRSVSLRYFNAAGADPDGEIGEHHVPETHLVALLIKDALHGYSVSNAVLSAIKQGRSWTHVVPAGDENSEVAGRRRLPRSSNRCGNSAQQSDENHKQFK